jgi:hypothetical protein
MRTIRIIAVRKFLVELCGFSLREKASFRGAKSDHGCGFAALG